MTFDEYQQFAGQGIQKSITEQDSLVNHALGLTGESGEVVDLIKKKVFYLRNVPKEKFQEELGDVLWYVANIASEVGLTLDDIVKHNVEKLKNRYSDLY